MTRSGAHKFRRTALTLAAVMVFIGSLALTVNTLPKLELRGSKVPSKITINRGTDPGADAFFVSRGQRELSHVALFHDIGPSIENARKADILIIGNSRAQLGFNEEIFSRGAAKLGLRVFNLAVGHADSARFARDVLSRHNLSPKVLIASGDFFFYGNRRSDWAQEVVEMNRWQAYKIFFEQSIAWQLQSRLHDYLPYLDYFKRGRYPWVHYRSQESGWWRNTRIPGARYPVRKGEERNRYTRSMSIAQELKQELDDQGTLLVITLVPFPRFQTGHLPLFGDELDIPYIVPPFAGLETADGSHLAPDSAEKLSNYVWQQLIKDPQVRDRLGLPGEIL